MNVTREQGLLAWQWSTYPKAHRDRRNLVVHVVTEPLFVLGTCAIPLALVFGTWWLAALGIGAMLAVMALQGRAHKLEKTEPPAFRGPLDVLVRLLVEQWVTFPRYVLSGEFARAWRNG
jgi:Protein of unknown function (DUF962)